MAASTQSMDYLAAAVLGAIQGVTAWIPVSSKTQVLLAGNAFFNLTFAQAIAFALVLHAGDLVAAAAKYWREYLDALKQLFRPNQLTDFNALQKDDVITARFLVVSLVCTAILALPLYLLVKRVFSSISGEPLLALVGVLLLGMAGILYFTRQKPANPITLKTAVISGFAQALAVVPGVSRSGITQSALLLQGVPAEKAVRLSFVMSLPMIALAIAAFYAVEGGFVGVTIATAIIGIIVSAVVSWFTMDALTALARRVKPWWFVAAIGVLAIVPLALKLAVGVAG